MPKTEKKVTDAIQCLFSEKKCNIANLLNKQDWKSRLKLANKTTGTVNAKLNYIILTSVANHFP